MSIKPSYLTCCHCRYFGRETFENTVLHTCGFAYYILLKIAQSIKVKGTNQKVYTTDSLVCGDDECKFIDMFDIYNDYDN